jgi:hypothetical protein
MIGILLLLVCGGDAALPRNTDGWKVWDFGKKASSFVAPSSCVVWDNVRGRRHFACPASVIADACLIIADVGSLLRQQNILPKERAVAVLPAFFDVFRTFAEINAQLSNWNTAYPSLMTQTVIGTTFENRSITLVKVAQTTGKPIVFVNTGLQ